MSQPASIYLTCAGREMHVTAWGDPAAETVVAWHGLAAGVGQGRFPTGPLIRSTDAIKPRVG